MLVVAVQSFVLAPGVLAKLTLQERPAVLELWRRQWQWQWHWE